MFKTIVIDVDGVLIENKLARFFGDGNSLWLGKRPRLKRTLFFAIEIIEFMLGIRHNPNKELIDLLNLHRVDKSSVRFFIMTDRSFLGFQNVHDNISLFLRKGDFIQLRGNDKLQNNLSYLQKMLKAALNNKDMSWARALRKEIEEINFKIAQEEDKIKKELSTEAKILFSSAMKPHKDVLSHLVAITRADDPRKVLIIDNDQNFLRMASSFYEFVTFPSLYFNVKDGEAPDVFRYFLQKALCR